MNTLAFTTKKPLIIILTLSLFATTCIHSQNGSEPDSLKIEQYSELSLIKLNLSTETESFRYKSADGDLDIAPNNSYKLFLSADYKMIGFSFGFYPNFLGANSDEDLKGSSKFTDLQLRLFLGKFIQEVGYKKIEGYYIENTGDFLPDWEKGTDPYLQIPSLKNKSFYSSTSYVFNSDYSIKSLLYQKEWQKQSAGSLVPKLELSYNDISFDALGPSADNKTFNGDLSLGYYYTWVIGQHWYVAPNLAPGIGLKISKQTSTSDTEVVKDNYTFVSRHLDGGLQVGFNSKRFILGARVNMNVSWYNDESDGLVEDDQIFGIAFLGYRFDTPKIFSKTYHSVVEKTLLGKD